MCKYVVKTAVSFVFAVAVADAVTASVVSVNTVIFLSISPSIVIIVQLKMLDKLTIAVLYWHSL